MIVYVLIALIGAAVAVFALQNLDPVVIRFVVWRIEGAPLALVILLSIVSGAVLAALLGIVKHWQLRSRIRQLERAAQAQPSAPSPGRSGPVDAPPPRP